jgi:hypothetical protein
MITFIGAKYNIKNNILTIDTRISIEKMLKYENFIRATYPDFKLEVSRKFIIKNPIKLTVEKDYVTASSNNLILNIINNNVVVRIYTLHNVIVYFVYDITKSSHYLILKYSKSNNVGKLINSLRQIS